MGKIDRSVGTGFTPSCEWQWVHGCQVSG
jgi:hypothetical protein